MSENKRCVEVPGESLEEAAGLLALAFENDPFIRYMLSPREPDYLEKSRATFRFACEIRLELGQPLFGTMSGHRLTGVACVSGPEKLKWPDSLVAAAEKMKSALGEEANNRMEKFIALSHRYMPDAPHHYLGVLGVHPDFQKQGFGRLLLDAVHREAESHPKSTGVYLETATEQNAEMYRHFGYKLLGREKQDDTVDWRFMFRPDGVRS